MDMAVSEAQEGNKMGDIQMEQKDCTTCLWEYMCDWDKDSCTYVKDKK